MANGYIHIGTGGSINGERMLVMEPKHYFSRKFDCGEWTQLRLDFVFALTTDVSYESTIADVFSYDSTSIYNRLYMGLINGDLDEAFPGESGQYFAGVSTISGGSQSFQGGPALSDNVCYQNRNVIIEDGSVTFGSDANSEIYYSASQLNYIHNLIEFTRDTGAETLQVRRPFCRHSLAVSNQPSEAQMETFIDDFAGYGGTFYTHTFDWANTNPDLNAMFIYCPLPAARIRLHGIMVKKIS